MRFILSTIGTSILTNLIDRSNPKEANDWWKTLRDAANLKLDELEPEMERVINTLAERALDELNKNDAKTNCRISAELNGIYGIYGGYLRTNIQDQHCLICTDTAQGQKTGELIKKFLRNKGFNVFILTPEGLSTKNTESFAAGVKELIRQLEDTVPGYEGYRVIFNLVGGFKSLQGYMHTFGAFYADEIVYIFEAQTADLIKIPRLPIQIDDTVIREHLVQFALMDAGKLYLVSELEGIPETLLEYVKDDGNTYAGLSAWGQLIWNRAKRDLLTGELLDFPRLEYRNTFKEDFDDQSDPTKRLKLQETLAKVATMLKDTDGDTTQLNTKVSGLNFEKLQNYNFYTFRITNSIRVSCAINNGGLKLRHYGEHNYVNNDP